MLLSILRPYKGQILVLIVLILLAIVVIAAFLSLASVRVRAAPIVREVSWRVDDREVSVARLGQKVEAHIRIEAIEGYVGQIVVKIRKDVALWFDNDYHMETIPVNLKGAEEKEIEITFTPDEASGGRFRGYFVEIEFLGTRTTWVMENSYPPRLKLID